LIGSYPADFEGAKKAIADGAQSPFFMLSVFARTVVI
jgi:hypothetical protein